MIGPSFLSAALFCAVIWGGMTVMKMRVLNGLWRKTWMIGGLGFGALGLMFLGMGF